MRRVPSTAPRPLFRSTLIALLVGLAVPWAPSPAYPQATPPATGATAPAAPSAGSNVETDPIRCWTRASAGAVRIGEVFTVTLTCAVLETELVQVVPDETKLAVTVAQMNPFEVAGGNHPADIRTNSRRFFQYDYRIRMINPDAIGQDVAIPLLQITYRVNSRVQGNQAQQGREMTYILQPLWVKVVSMVPRDASDIRDTRDASFDRIEGIQFRAGVLEIVAITLVVLGGIMTLLALLGLLRRARKRTRTAEDRMMGRPALLRLAARELAQVQKAAAGGWTDALVNQAMSALRIAAAGALERPISQRFVGPDDQPGEGRFIVRPLGRLKRIAVSAPTTAEDVSQALARLRPNASASRRQLLEELQEALSSLAAAQYGRPGADRAHLDETVRKAADLARRVRSQHSGPREWLRRLTMRLPLVQQQA
ncbi:MAG: hypothetical protein AB7I13_10640 [Vicinamibacterales bacterium]